MRLEFQSKRSQPRAPGGGARSALRSVRLSPVSSALCEIRSVCYSQCSRAETDSQEAFPRVPPSDGAGSRTRGVRWREAASCEPLEEDNKDVCAMGATL